MVRSHFWAWDIFFSFVEDLKREVFVELSVNLATPLRGQIWVLVAERMERHLYTLVPTSDSPHSPENSGDSFRCHLIHTIFA